MRKCRKCFTALWALTLSFAFVACDAFDYHPYCVDISGPTDINARNAQCIAQLTQGMTAFRFAFISDTQRWYDETEDMVRDINRRTDLDFVIHGGDFTDFGINDEFLWQRDILEELNVPYVSVIGNHDCLATGKQSYQRIWGPLNWSFSAGDVHFVCLNTNALEFDYSMPVPDMDFIESEIVNFPDSCSRSLIVAHSMPGDEQFNNNLSRYYHAMIKALPGILCSISGHVHAIKHEDLFGDGFIYHSTTCAKDRQYLIFDISDNGYSYETVSF